MYSDAPLYEIEAEEENALYGIEVEEENDDPNIDRDNPEQSEQDAEDVKINAVLFPSEPNDNKDRDEDEIDYNQYEHRLIQGRKYRSQTRRNIYTSTGNSM